MLQEILRVSVRGVVGAIAAAYFMQWAKRHGVLPGLEGNVDAR